jgi:hypothetical protein
MDEITRVLVGCTDAQVWARKFIETQRVAPDIATDEGTMIGWFANAIMSGYDAGQKAERERDFMDKLREVIYQAAGAATLPFMQDHPDDVMPTERVIEGIEAVCRDFGIPPREREPA